MVLVVVVVVTAVAATEPRIVVFKVGMIVMVLSTGDCASSGGGSRVVKAVEGET